MYAWYIVKGSRLFRGHDCICASGVFLQWQREQQDLSPVRFCLIWYCKLYNKGQQNWTKLCLVWNLVELSCLYEQIWQSSVWCCSILKVMYVMNNFQTNIQFHSTFMTTTMPRAETYLAPRPPITNRPPPPHHRPPPTHPHTHTHNYTLPFATIL